MLIFVIPSASMMNPVGTGDIYSRLTLKTLQASKRVANHYQEQANFENNSYSYLGFTGDVLRDFLSADVSVQQSQCRQRLEPSNH